MQAFWKRAGCGSIPSERRTVLVVPSKGPREICRFNDVAERRIVASIRGERRGRRSGAIILTSRVSVEIWFRRQPHRSWNHRCNSARPRRRFGPQNAAESRLFGSGGHEFEIFNHPAEEVQVCSARARQLNAYFVPIGLPVNRRKVRCVAAPVRLAQAIGATLEELLISQDD